MKEIKVSWKPVEAYLMSSQNADENQMDRKTESGIQWAVVTAENQLNNSQTKNASAEPLCVFLCVSLCMKTMDNDV